MAVIKSLETMDLQVKVNNGVSAGGKALEKNYNFSSLNPEATPEVVYDTASRLSKLIDHDTNGIYTKETHSLVSEA